jgi:hypothetical protein
MTKVRIRKTIARTRWQLVTFLGPHGRESVGIVDLMAIRKDHAPGKDGLKRGDRFEIILIQVKGGLAAYPSPDDMERLRIVAEIYQAREILLAQWKRGKEVVFSRLKAGLWEPISSPAEVFR